ncbi:E3 ubiquitin-protein ligase GW2-like [Phragmites australis]|uniref:E3 ubiquitin-protein ligase GW2-like n=1 Tax=Phragmites australis TaxID=29695 RepID=UPI002D78F39A|nr:E3 ubiquitin-protein ligase GW2-like [Phragmites australis]
MGNRVGGRRRQPAVEERHTRPQGLYPHPDIDLKKLRRLILEAKLAPCYPGADDPRADLDECPICFLFYPSLNRSKCCAKGICTECFLQMKSPTSCRPTQCPYCKMVNYAVEYRGVRTKEEKGIEQIEEQRVIEAQIRMRQQELQDDAERMKNKQTAASTDTVATARLECCDTGGTSTTVASSAQGTDTLSSQVQHSELLLRNSEGLKQMRGNNFDMDLEEVMLMEAIWLSIQDQEALGNPSSVATASPTVPSESYDGSVTTTAEAASSSGFACAVAALAEQQHRYGESSSAATCQKTSYDILSRSDRSFTEDLSIAGSSSSDTRTEEPSSSRTHQTIDGVEYSNDRWSEVAEAGTSCAGSDVTVEAGAANLTASVGSNIGSGSVPDSFEEQMMLAMALSLVDARARASSPGLTWR